MVNSEITAEEKRFLHYLGQALRDGGGGTPALSDRERAQMFALADRHEVSALAESVLGGAATEEDRLSMQRKTARTVHKGIRLQALNARLVALLEQAGILAVTLKGCAVARLYPTPEFRKTTDIDLFFFEKADAKKAASLLCAQGFQPTGAWHANHHEVLLSEKNETVELHTAWAETFKERRLNRCLAAIQKESRQHCGFADCCGARLYVYDAAYQAFYLLIHMLQHFVAGGFGLRNLCDWAVLWERCKDEADREGFCALAKESGTATFAKAVTAVCVEYLGLRREDSPYPHDASVADERRDALLRDILDAGEFGCGEAARMVGMDGDSIWAYVKEFQHQMHINFPRAGRIPLFWPILWAATLVRFLQNNKRLRRAPVFAILKKAGKRGALVGALLSDRRENS